MNSDLYLHLLDKWAPIALKDIYKVPGRPDLACYGTGYNSWGVQTNQKAFAAFAVLAAAPESDIASTDVSKRSLLETSLALLRFSLESHIEGSAACLDGEKWGHTWISALGVERMMHGVDALRDSLSPADLTLLKRVLISEADWLMDNYDIVGHPDGNSGKKKPESNLWNGALLHRTAALYPDTPRAAAYREKGSKFLINSISTPSDEQSVKVVDGKMVKERFAGANFFESLSLDHHSYLNVGYMVICLSNAAMLHFSLKRLGVTPPEALSHHLEELWHLVKNLTFPDGRLWRIGGDTRARYCYCQDYLIPSWLLAADYFDDHDAPVFEQEWLRKVAAEQEHNGDGSFLSDRCRPLRSTSPLYYTRLESDRACAISMGAYWRRMFHLPTTTITTPASATKSFSWSEPFHGAALHRDSSRAASWVWRGAEGPCGVFVPTHASDMAEWRQNLAGESRGLGRKNWSVVKYHTGRCFDGGFITCGSFTSRSGDFIAEGETDKDLVLHHAAFAALPDSATGIVLQKARALIRCHLSSVKGLNLLVPNDIFNGCKRVLGLEDGTSQTVRWKGPGKERTWDTGSRSLVADNILAVRLVYGGDSLVLHAPAERQIGLRMKPEGGGMLNALEICSTFSRGCAEYEQGATLFDMGGVVFASSGKIANAMKAELKRIECGAATDCRAVLIEGADGRRYLFAVNFGDQPADAELALPAPSSEVERVSGGGFSQAAGGALTLSLPPCGSQLLRLHD